MLRVLVVSVTLAGCAGDGELEALQARFPLGADLAAVAAAAQAHCARVDTQTYSPEEAAPYTSQVQVNCHGYVLAGQARKIELLVNEGALGFYWVLIDAEELAAMDRRLAVSVGAGRRHGDDYVIYAGDSVALRREPAEILIGIPRDVCAITGGCP